MESGFAVPEEEALDFAQHCLGVADEGVVISAGKFDKPGVGNLLGDVPSVVDRH
jgi:hypothetical protein